MAHTPVVLNNLHSDNTGFEDSKSGNVSREDTESSAEGRNIDLLDSSSVVVHGVWGGEGEGHVSISRDWFVNQQSDRNRSITYIKIDSILN